MDYNFDQIINRKNTHSIKHDFADAHRKPVDALPLWVADMDFQTAQEIIDALAERSRHGIFGYTEVTDSYFTALEKWFSERFDWTVEENWLIKTPGVVFALCAAIRSLTLPGDSVLIQRPVYYPFSASVWDNGRKLVNNPLVYRHGEYSIDFIDFEQKIIDHQVKLFLLSSPHNPVGRVWTKEELTKLGDICLKHHVVVISDEIHADFVFPGYKHHVFSQLKPEYNDITITCTAPSKTFNLAGLQISNIFIPNPEIRRKFHWAIQKTSYAEINTMGVIACEIAYTQGRDWLEQLKRYLTGNLKWIRTFLKEKIPKVKLIEPEGMYLIWLDFSALDLDEKQLDELVTSKAKLWLNPGTKFGPEGAGFQRINIACPRATLEQAFSQLETAIAELPTG